MKLYDLLKIMTFEDYIVMLRIPDIPYPENNINIYDWKNDDRERIKPYLDYVVEEIAFLKYGYFTKEPCLMIIIKGQKKFK